MEEWLRKNDPSNPNLIEINGVLYLKPGTIVHHDGAKYPISSIENKQDNRFKNLKLFVNHSQHKDYHNKRGL